MGWFELESDSDAWRTASLRYIGRRLSFPSYVMTVPSEEQLDSARKMLSEARDWTRGINDARMRRECEQWCDHSQHCIDECERERKTNAFTNRMRAIGERWKKSEKTASDILSKFR